jgi:hypothetical protein
LTQEKGFDGSNFITLGKIPGQEKIEIIKLGFQRQAEGIISLKKYYESIRRTKLYQKLKP